MGRYYIGFCFIEKQQVKLQVSGNPLCPEIPALTLYYQFCQGIPFYQRRPAPREFTGMHLTRMLDSIT